MIDIKNPSDLQEHILTADVAVLDFWAPWCGPCRALAPTLDALEKKNPELVIGKVNVDENPGLAKAAGIRGIPALVLFKKGETLGMLTGSQSLEKLQQFVDGANR
jgi:thioredoxin 1